MPYYRPTPHRFKRPKLVCVARDARNANHDYMIEEEKAKALYDAGYYAWSPDTKCYIDEGGRGFRAIRNGLIKFRVL
jgi:hypothetical protein